MEMNMTSQNSRPSMTTTSTAATQVTQSALTASNANKLVLISSIISNWNAATTKKDSIFIIAAIIGLYATYLIRVSAYEESNEQQISPGVTTFANNLKMLSSSLALIAGSIAFWALLIESSLRAQGITAPRTSAHAANPTVASAALSQ